MRDKSSGWHYKRINDQMISTMHPIYGVFSSFSIRDTNQVGALTQDIGYSAANLAFYAPISLPKEYLVDYVFLHTGSSVSGNADIGVYDARTLNLIFSSGSTALSGAEQQRRFALSNGPKLLKPGAYYLGLAVSTTSVHISGNSLNASFSKIVGIYEQSSAFPLPTTMSVSTISTRNYLPIIGIGRNLT